LSHVSDIAQVQCARGGLVLPACSPYDRQLLREHVEKLVAPCGSLQLGLDGNEWTITRLREELSSCTGCSQPLRLLRCRRTADDTLRCIRCVLSLSDDQG
jgi:hypothetical protein